MGAMGNSKIGMPNHLGYLTTRGVDGDNYKQNSQHNSGKEGKNRH